MGADDYITKPFEIEELFARMRVALRNKKEFKKFIKKYKSKYKIKENKI